ncbi:hypothetical protein JKP88DRAFT_131842, partial [Tribonema minus]
LLNSPGDLRAAVTHGVLHDLDVVNCHPAIALQLLDLSAPVLVHFNANREQWYADIGAKYAVDRKTAKAIMHKLTFGGGLAFTTDDGRQLVLDSAPLV